MVQVLKEIEEVSPSKDQYSNLCLLLTMNKLSDHPDYKSWNPSKGRHKCFREVLPLVEELLGGDHRNRSHPGGGNVNTTQPEDPSNPDEMVSSNDRLLQLIIKGILYESCVDFCQQKATGAKHSDHIKFTNLLSQSDFSDSDLSLLSWLQSIPGKIINLSILVENCLVLLKLVYFCYNLCIEVRNCLSKRELQLARASTSLYHCCSCFTI